MVSLSNEADFLQRRPQRQQLGDDTRERVERYARKIGAEITENRRAPFLATATAPHGYVWNESSTHQIVEESWINRKEALVNLLARMRDGVRPCEDTGCTFCGNDAAFQDEPSGED